MENSIQIGPVKNHRKREGALVYPVYSRRSRGLSVGINLFPNGKFCSFDCPYCEVFPFMGEMRFNSEDMEESLRLTLVQAKAEGLPVRDICFSGNGEPSLSPDFPDVFKRAALIRDEIFPEAELVIITNGTGLLEENRFDFLCREACQSLRVWLKVDAGTEAWFRKMNRPFSVDFDRLTNNIKKFAASAPFIIQTMICKVGGETPPPEEERAWLELVSGLAAPGLLRSVQIYGKARPSPEDPLAEAVETVFLEERAAALRKILASCGLDTEIGVYP